MELKRDTRLGKYNIRGRIGDGGMGIVYRAFDEHLQRGVAIKTIHRDKASDRAFLNRFKREAFAIARFEDPHIVRLLDFVEGTADQPPYMVMELLEGRDLAKIIAKDGPLDIIRAVDRIVEVVAAVTQCHRFGYIHRDLKPSNIFIAEYNRIEMAKVLDFGATKQERVKAGSARDLELTQKGDVWGTPFYMAPEQLIGTPASPLSDQYSIAVILYQALAGKRPFDTEDKKDCTDLELLASIKAGVHIPLREHRPEIPAGLAAAIARAMNVDPAKRYPDLHEFGGQLRPYASRQAQLTWERHFTSTIPSPRDPELSIAINPEDDERTRPRRDSPFNATNDQTFPPLEGSSSTARTVAERANLGFATTAKRDPADPSLSLQITVDDPPSSRTPSSPSDTPVIRKEEAMSKALRNRPLLLLASVVVLFGGVLGAALFITHRKEPAPRIAVPPPILLSPTPPAASPVAPPPPAPAAPMPSAPLQAPPPQEPPALAAAAEKRMASSPTPPTHKHHHKKTNRRVLDQHGIPIPTD